ncbi:hypothetical protein PanWU01x14_370360 [Parasponia andersonii]|uniref:Uncharacterized protein n=1 Tax=Parasponia andersonii TaxID=3476 RepID=A0A2P5A4A3_PARAD|nr:hypothetical protein PanWU01x14_370360 [Parasponia andersonii]
MPGAIVSLRHLSPEIEPSEDCATVTSFFPSSDVRSLHHHYRWIRLDSSFDFRPLSASNSAPKIARELHRFACHGPVPYRDPFSMNFISKPMFLGVLNSVVISVSQSETSFEKSTFQVNVTRFKNDCPINPVIN